MGSNNWAVSGAHTDTGRPLVAGDPHQGLSSPTRLWPVHMVGSSLDVIGFAFVGTPTVQLGHNARVGWTATINIADVMDLWGVSLDEDGANVLLADGAHPVVERKETVRIREEDGTFRERKITLRDVPGYGVLLPKEVIPVSLVLLTDAEALLFQWTGFRPSREMSAYLAMDRAENLDQWEKAADLLDVGAVNLVAADANGISYRVHAAVPDRGDPASHPMPWRILDGMDPESLWTRGDLPDDKLPHDRDPARGFVFTANQDPFGFTKDGNVENDPFYYGAFYANGARAYRIREVLGDLVARGNVTRGDMEALQADVHSPFADSVAPLVAQAIEDLDQDPTLSGFAGNADIRSIATQLGAWDRRFDKEAGEPLLFLGVVWYASRQMLRDALTPLLFDAVASASPQYMLGIAVNVLTDRFEGSETFYPKGKSYVLLSAMEKTAAWLRTKFGTVDAKKLALKTMQAASFGSDYGGEQEGGRFPVSGGPDTVDVAGTAFFGDDGEPRSEFTTGEMALYRMVIGFDAEGRADATFDFAMGTSEDPASPHFRDLQDRWVNVRHETLPFRQETVRARSTASYVLSAGSSRLSPHREGTERRIVRELFHGHVVDPRVRRPSAGPGEERLDRGGVPLGDEFHAPVREVTHPSAQPEPARLLFRRRPIEDALDPAGDPRAHRTHRHRTPFSSATEV
jgi:penicillin G amidase